MADIENLPRPLFGQVAIMANYCTQQQIDECLQVQAKGKSEGTHFYLGTILINKGYLTLEQALKILKYQKVQIVEDPSNSNNYNVHAFSAKKKYRSPESNEFLKIPQEINSISVRGDMGLKKVEQESQDAVVQEGTLFDIENQTYEMSLGGTAVDITSLNLEVDSRATTAKPISFDEIEAQADNDGALLDPFGGNDFSENVFDESMDDFREAEPVFSDENPFGDEDDPFASSVEMFNEAEEAEQPEQEKQSKFPKHMNSSFYVSGADDVEAKPDEEWSAWEDGEEAKSDDMHIDRTLDGPVMAELTSEEQAISDDFDLEDGATMMDSDAGIAMGAELRDLVEKENLDFSETAATSFEDAANLMEVEGSRLDFDVDQFDFQGEADFESVEASDSNVEDPFANVSEGDFADGFGGEMSEDPFATAAEDYPETIQDEPLDADLMAEEEESLEMDSGEEFDESEQWQVTESKEEAEPELEGEVQGADFWDGVPGSESEIETEQPGISDDFFAQQLADDQAPEDDDVEMLEIEDESEQLYTEIAERDSEKMKTLGIFTPDGELRDSVRQELVDPNESAGELEGEIAQAVGALGGEIASTAGELEGDVLDLSSEGAAELIELEPETVDPIAKQLKKKRKKDIDFIEDFSLEEITSLDQEVEEGVVREEKTDIDIQYVREEQTDLDIKRPSGWRSLFYGRKAGDSKAHVNIVYLLFFFVGLAIMAGGVALLSDFAYGDGNLITKYTAFLNPDYTLEETDISDEIWDVQRQAFQLSDKFEFTQALDLLKELLKKHQNDYKDIYQSDQSKILDQQKVAQQNMYDEYNAAIARTKDQKSIEAALRNTTNFIAKYQQKPYSNITQSSEYINNAQAELGRIEIELKNESIPKEPELINRLRSVAAWVPSELENAEKFELEYQQHNATLNKIITEALPYWQKNKPEVYKRVLAKHNIVSNFFDKESYLCELLIKQNNTGDLDIKNIWEAIEKVKEAEKIAREYEEFDSVMKTDWILAKKQEINDEYVKRAYAGLQKSFAEAEELTEENYKLKIKLLNELNAEIVKALTLDLTEEIRAGINEMKTNVDGLLTDLIRFSNYTDWRAAAMQNLEDGNIDTALEFFEKIYPFKEDENPKEINDAYKKCQYMVVKRDAPIKFRTALEYNANLNEYSSEQLMNAWADSYEIYSKMFELLFNENGSLVEYAYDDNMFDGFAIVNDCIDSRLISETLKYLWTAQYQYEKGHAERDYEIFKSAKENYKKALPYFNSHFESFKKQANEIEVLIVKCDFEPLKLESEDIREQAITLLEMNIREKAEEALRLVEYSTELWHDALTIEQNNEFNDYHARDVNELITIAKLNNEIKRAIRKHIYNEKLAEASMYEQNEDFDKAMSILENAKYYTNDLRWLEKYNKKLQIKKLVKESKALADQDEPDYPGAIALLEKATKIDPLEREPYVLKNKFSYKNSKIKIRNANAAEMALIKGGTAIMHSGNEVAFNDYYIDKNEVTNADYGKFLEFLKSIDGDDSMFRHPDQPTDVPGLTGVGVRSHLPKCWNFPGYNDPNQPVVGVNFWDAYAYAKWAGKRLPSVSEWEYASAGKQRRLYPWGNEELISNAFCVEMAKSLNRSYPRLVSALVEGAVSGTEILNMVGNVREWTAKAGPELNEAAVMGGSFRSKLKDSSNDKSIMLELSSWDDETGFRCVMDK